MTAPAKITGTSRHRVYVGSVVNTMIPERLTMLLGHRTLLVVAGLPGAGKSTLLRDTDAAPNVTLLDTDDVRGRLAALLPGVPYSWYRPLVHLLHSVRLVRSAVRARGPLVVHDPATGPVARAVFVALGALTRRTRYLLWIDCTVEEALAGQRTRGRLLPTWSFARHARNAARTRRRLLAGAVPPGWKTVIVTDRDTTRRGLRIPPAGGATPSGRA